MQVVEVRCFGPGGRADQSWAAEHETFMIPVLPDLPDHTCSTTRVWLPTPAQRDLLLPWWHVMQPRGLPCSLTWCGGGARAEGVHGQVNQSLRQAALTRPPCLPSLRFERMSLEKRGSPPPRCVAAYRQAAELVLAV